MTVAALLRQMEIIARKLIKPENMEDFTKYNRCWVKSSKGASPFYWVVREEGAHIHPKHDLKEVVNAFFYIQLNQRHNLAEEYMIFEYDGENLYPVFPRQLLKWGKNHPEYKQYL